MECEVSKLTAGEDSGVKHVDLHTEVLPEAKGEV